MTNRAGIETRERILSSTRDLLASGGLEAATVAAICREAGVLPGSFYNLFESKEQAVLTVVRQAITAVDPDPGHTGSDSLSDLVEAYIRFFTTEETLARVYLIVAVSGGLTDRTIGGRVLRHHRQRVARFREALLRQSPELGEESATLRVESLLAALNGYALHKLLDPGFDFAAHARRLLEQVPA